MDAAALAAGEPLAAEAVVLPPDSAPDSPLLHRPLKEQAPRSAHQCSGAGHLEAFQQDNQQALSEVDHGEN